MNGELYDKITKQRLPIIIAVDTSSSMRGNRLAQVNESIGEIHKYLTELQDESPTVDFSITLLTFDTEARFVEGCKNTPLAEFSPPEITAGGYSNLHLAYEKLGGFLKRESEGGSMPDFGGVAPIILLITDGHPTKSSRTQLKELKKLPWFRASLRYGIAIEQNDDKTATTLSEFTEDPSCVVDCIDSDKLAKMIRVIVLTASKVRSRSSSVDKSQDCKQIIKQQIRVTLEEIDDWEW